MPNEPTEDFLSHYGVLGMKWGVRKDRTSNSKQNANYSDAQRKRDTQLYGKRGSKRINKRMNQGDTVSTARGSEVKRYNKAAKNARTARKVGGVVGGLAGAGALPAAKAFYNSGAFHKSTKVVLEGVFGNSSPQVQGGVRVAARIADRGFYEATHASPAVNAGLMMVGSILGSDIGRRAGTGSYMRTKGYDPNRMR